MVHRMYVTANSGSASSSIDMPADAHIVGIQLDTDAVGVVDAGTVEAAVSFSSTNEFVSHDARSALAHVKSTFEITTSGGGQPGKVVFNQMNEAVGAGERLYLHLSTSHTTGTARALVFTDVEALTLKRAGGRRAGG